MHISKALLFTALSSMSTASVFAQTSVIAENLTGTISGDFTKDTVGLFGPVGAELKNKQVLIHTQYVPAYFGATRNCRFASSCNENEAQNTPNTPGAVLIAVTINGKQATFTSTHYGALLFGKTSDHLFSISADAGSFGFGYTGATVNTSFTSPVLFDTPLSPANQPVFTVNTTNLVQFFSPSSQTAVEILTYKVTSATD